MTQISEKSNVFVRGKFHDFMGYFGHQVNKGARQAYEIMPKDEEFEVVPLYFGCLEAIKLNPDINQVDLSQIIGHSTAVIARALHHLETHGYLERIRDKQDRRNNTLKLTQAGETYLENGMELLDTLEQDLLKDFTEDEVKVLKKLLNRFIKPQIQRD